MALRRPQPATPLASDTALPRIEDDLDMRYIFKYDRSEIHPVHPPSQVSPLGTAAFAMRMQYEY